MKLANADYLYTLDPAEAALQPGAQSWDSWAWPSSQGEAYPPNAGPQLPTVNTSGGTWNWQQALNSVLQTGVAITQADVQRDIARARAFPTYPLVPGRNYLQTGPSLFPSMTPMTMLIIGGAVLAFFLLSKKSKG